MLPRVVIEHPFLGFFSLPVLAVCILTLLGFGGRFWWLFDLASHFRAQYFFILLFSSLVFLIGNRPGAAGGTAFFALINLVLIAPLYIHPTSAVEIEKPRRLLLLNVLQRNNYYEDVRNLIHSTQPDIIVLVETNQTWLDELSEFQSSYPFWQNRSREDNFGVALLSRLPFQHSEILYFSDARVPSVVANIQIDQHSLTVIGTHPPPPKGALNSQYRNQQLENLADFARSQPGEVILCGDLNMSPWSPYFWGLMQRSGLKNSARGFGLQLSWPTDRPLLRVPIDHCLVSGGVTISGRQIGPFVGSDHFPVIIDFAFNHLT